MLFRSDQVQEDSFDDDEVPEELYHNLGALAEAAEFEKRRAAQALGIRNAAGELEVKLIPLEGLKQQMAQDLQSELAAAAAAEAAISQHVASHGEGLLAGQLKEALDKRRQRLEAEAATVKAAEEVSKKTP